MRTALAIPLAFVAVVVDAAVADGASARPFLPGENPGAFTGRISNFLDPALTSGALARVPWADTYWPANRGGIAWRWRNDARPAPADLVGWRRARAEKLSDDQLARLSPAEKWGLLRGEEEPDFARAVLAANFASSPDWMGSCNGWSIAALQYPEPAAVAVPVAREGRTLTFGASDVKALLTYNAELAQRNVSSVPGAFLGACDIQGRGCPRAGLNPGALHLVLQERLGRRGRGVILDLAPGDEKWNFPVHAFETRELAREPGRVTFRTTIRYRVETDPAPLGFGDAGHGAGEAYCYVLELDARGGVVGGDYLQDVPGALARFPECASADGVRPDYAWYKEDVPFSAALPGLAELYAASTAR